jgi:hypothetical protein
MRFEYRLIVASLAVAVTRPLPAPQTKVRSADGNALEGVLTRLTDPISGVSESVFTRSDGTFDLTTHLAGQLELRLRTPYFRDTNAGIELAKEGSMRRDDLVMLAMQSDAEISESLPAAYHFGSLPFETGDDALFNRYQFQRDCLTCHQIGNPLTRVARTAEQWSGTIQRMPVPRQLTRRSASGVRRFCRKASMASRYPRDRIFRST